MCKNNHLSFSSTYIIKTYYEVIWIKIVDHKWIIPGRCHGGWQHLVSFLPRIPQLSLPHSKLLIQCESSEQPPSPRPHGSVWEQHPESYFDISRSCRQYTLLLGRQVPWTSLGLRLFLVATRKWIIFHFKTSISSRRYYYVGYCQKIIDFLPFEQRLGHNCFAAVRLQSTMLHNWFTASSDCLILFE